MVREGLPFTIASARSAGSALPILKSIDLIQPLILLNGVIIYDPIKNQNEHVFSIKSSAATYVKDVFQHHGRNPFMFSIDKDNVSVSFTELLLDVQKKFYESRKNSPFYKSFQQVNNLTTNTETVIYFSLCDEKYYVDTIIDDLKLCNDIRYVSYRDTYTDYWYLEVFSHEASKGNAVLMLKNMLNIEKIIVFGDNDNDTSMFKVADYAYAVSNAEQSILQLADDIIGKNDEDGVVKKIETLFYSQ